MVLNGLDDGEGSLRAAIVAANDEVTNPGHDTIEFAPGVTHVTLTTEQLTLTSDVTIAGPVGGVTIARDQGASGGIFVVDAGSNDLAVDPQGQPLAFDQRGTAFSRIVGGIVDIGAFESPYHPPVAADVDVTTPEGTPVANYNGLVPAAVFTVSDGFLTATATLTIRVLSPSEQVAELQEDVLLLLEQEALNEGQTTALLTQLDQADALLAGGQTQAANNLIRALLIQLGNI